METRVPMMTAAQVRAVLADARRLGARDYYFTGGEPMMHREFWALCEETLAQGPLTVLTNGLYLDAAAAARARALFDRSRYSFDLRVSLDGMSAEENDPVRGRGTFAQITAGIAQLAAVGLSPTLTVVEHADGMAAATRRSEFLAFCRELGLARPRLKFLPLLRLGREPHRTREYAPDELELAEARLGERLAEAMSPISLRWAACKSCVADGLSCNT
jgi:molybdenum cofactor biosynthesis enzyme MoaA